MFVKSVLLSPVHTSDNVAKNGDNVAETGNIVFLATMLPVSAGVDGALNGGNCVVAVEMVN